MDGWNVIDDEALVAWREYPFTRGAFATTFVFGGVDGLVVVSPGLDVPPAALDALAALGEVRALVANNSWHHLGQTAWRARFPEAVSYAAPAALPALAKKAPTVPFRPLSELALPARVIAEALPGFSTGEVLFRVGTARGAVWFTGDLLTNLQRTPPPPIRWLFTWSGSAPGYRLFRPAVWMFVRDRAALRERLLALVASEPPVVVVSAHGPAVVDGDVAALTRAQIERL